MENKTIDRGEVTYFVHHLPTRKVVCTGNKSTVQDFLLEGDKDAKDYKLTYILSSSN